MPTWSQIKTDAFTRGSDATLQIHDTDWSKHYGPDMNVLAASDDVRAASTGADSGYRWNGTDSPTGTQRIIADLFAVTGGNGFCGFAMRDDGTDAYVVTGSDTTVFKIYDYNGGAFDVLNSFTFTQPAATSTTTECICEDLTTGNPNIRLIQGANDENASPSTIKHTSGLVGFHIFDNSVTGDARIDNLFIYKEAVTSTVGPGAYYDYYRRIVLEVA